MANHAFVPDCELPQQASPVPTLRCCSSSSGRTAVTQLQPCYLLIIWLVQLFLGIVRSRTSQLWVRVAHACSRTTLCVGGPGCILIADPDRPLYQSRPIYVDEDCVHTQLATRAPLTVFSLVVSCTQLRVSCAASAVLLGAIVCVQVMDDSGHFNSGQSKLPVTHTLLLFTMSSWRSVHVLSCKVDTKAT